MTKTELRCDSVNLQPHYAKFLANPPTNHCTESITNKKLILKKTNPICIILNLLPMFRHYVRNVTRVCQAPVCQSRQPLYHNVFSILSPRLLIWTAWTVIDNNLYTRCANSDWAQSLGCIFSWMRLESAEMRKYVTQIQPENQQKWPVMPFWFRFRWTRKLNADLNMNDEKCDSRLNASPIY